MSIKWKADKRHGQASKADDGGSFNFPAFLFLDTRKGSFVAGLVPVVHPGVRADANGVLAEGGALILVSGLLEAEEPFVVAVEAVSGLVLRREANVTGSGADVLELLDQIFLLGGEVLEAVADEELREEKYHGKPCENQYTNPQKQKEKFVVII